MEVSRWLLLITSPTEASLGSDTDRTVIHGITSATANRATAITAQTTAGTLSRRSGLVPGSPNSLSIRRTRRSSLPNSTVASAAMRGTLLPSPAPLVAQNLPDDVAARDAGDAAAAMRARPRLVQPLDRGAQVGIAGGGAAVEHL